MGGLASLARRKQVVAGEVGKIEGVAGEVVCCTGRVSSGVPVCPLLPLFGKFYQKFSFMRHDILNPYLPAFNERKQEMLSHQYLFNCYVLPISSHPMGSVLLQFLMFMVDSEGL